MCRWLFRLGCQCFCLAMICALLVAFPLPAAAQGVVATTFDELRFKVKDGDTVFVTGDDGTEQEAKIVRLSGSLLVVSIGTAQRELTEDSVSRIRQRVPDRLRNGAAIGALVGAVPMMFLANAMEAYVLPTGL